MFDLIIKSIPTTFIVFGDKEFNANDFKLTLEEFIDNNYLSEYYLDTAITDFLVSINILKYHIGMGKRMIISYEKTPNFNKFYDNFISKRFDDCKINKEGADII